MNLQCPMPTFDFDVITVGHGSGGLLTHNLLKSGVFNLLSNPWLDQQHDGAIFEINGKVAFSADSYVISPLFFPGGNIGDLAINGTVNDLAMCGAKAKYLSLSFIIEEGLPIHLFWDVLTSIKLAAEKAGVYIVTGDTKVVEKGKGDLLFINTSGIGEVNPNAEIHHQRIVADDVILISGNIAAHGIAIMSVREGLTFESSIISDTQPLNDCVIALLDHFGSDVKFLRDATRGGVASVLNEVVEMTSLGIILNQSDIPLEEEVSSACEMLGFDPLYVANEGVFITIVSKNKADDILQFLKGFPASKNAAIVGAMQLEFPKKVILKSSIGGSRLVNYLPGEQLPRIC